VILNPERGLGVLRICSGWRVVGDESRSFARRILRTKL